MAEEVHWKKGCESAAPQDSDFVRQARQLARDTEAVLNDLRGAGRETRRFLETSLRERPYETLVLAAAVGYVAAGGLASRLTRLAIGSGGRMALTRAAHEILRGAESAARGEEERRT